jgi:hypothetical protein
VVVVEAVIEEGFSLSEGLKNKKEEEEEQRRGRNKRITNENKHKGEE